VNENETKVSGKEKELGEEYFTKINKNLQDFMDVKFFDEVFDAQPTLSKDDYLNLVSKKAAWIYSAKDIRE